MSNKRNISYVQALNEAQDICLKRDKNVFIIGLGVSDPKGVFGSTQGLVNKYGAQRVMDMPASENAVTGICIGAAINGLRPILTHQRIDFSLLSLDQIINHAAKWFYMYGGQKHVPMVIRMIIGRGWGQGAQHSQNLQALFAHIPGLKVIMPTTPYDAKGMLIAAVEDDDPVIFIEHRWLYGNEGEVPERYYTVPLDKAQIVRSGGDITIVSSSYMTIEVLRACEKLEKIGVFADVIDLRSVRPIDDDLIFKSVNKTGKILVVESAWRTASISAEIISRVSENCFDSLKIAPKRINLPEIPTPTSHILTKLFYPGVKEICEQVCAMTGNGKFNLLEFDEMLKYDVPSEKYVGPY